uniref:Uncharacterized protein MANES_08G007300 n=1 Tax=Rhizophora mucronata TaxID=61149 RepID=A0A2P2LCC4_RHIMU
MFSFCSITNCWSTLAASSTLCLSLISSLSHLAALSASSSYFILHSADSSSASLLARSNCLLQEFQCI